QPTIRPMYPSPASAYRPQVQQTQPMPPPIYPQIPNQNAPAPSSNYPYPQYNNNGTTPYVPSTFPGQLPPMPYPMGGNTNGA
ncbi:unnamed protein product, partial [Rotaria magnacalcarata]